MSKKKNNDPHDLADVMAEEMSRGTQHQTKAVTRNRRRKIKRLADMLADPNCDERAFLAAIRGYGLQEGSAQFSEAMRLWRQRHGNA
jgi:hypothetical protein